MKLDFLSIRFFRSLTLLFILFGLVDAAVHANDITERRIQISLPVFPRVVAVDNDFQRKLAKDSRVSLVFLYGSNPSLARELAQRLRDKLTNIAGHEFTVQALSISSQTLGDTVPTAMFIADHLPQKLFEVALEFAIKNQRILYSPYPGDVERGATAGISITSRVNPYFNLRTLESSNIKINALLMNLSKVYE